MSSRPKSAASVGRTALRGIVRRARSGVRTSAAGQRVGTRAGSAAATSRACRPANAPISTPNRPTNRRASSRAAVDRGVRTVTLPGRRLGRGHHIRTAAPVGLGARHGTRRGCRSTGRICICDGQISTAFAAAEHRGVRLVAGSSRCRAHRVAAGRAADLGATLPTVVGNSASSAGTPWASTDGSGIGRGSAGACGTLGALEVSGTGHRLATWRQRRPPQATARNTTAIRLTTDGSETGDGWSRPVGATVFVMRGSRDLGDRRQGGPWRVALHDATGRPIRRRQGVRWPPRRRDGAGAGTEPGAGPAPGPSGQDRGGPAGADPLERSARVARSRRSAGSISDGSATPSPTAR
jgi:hypothetical protein